MWRRFLRLASTVCARRAKRTTRLCSRPWSPRLALFPSKAACVESFMTRCSSTAVETFWTQALTRLSWSQEKRSRQPSLHLAPCLGFAGSITPSVCFRLLTPEPASARQSPAHRHTDKHRLHRLTQIPQTGTPACATTCASLAAVVRWPLIRTSSSLTPIPDIHPFFPLLVNDRSGAFFHEVIRQYACRPPAHATTANHAPPSASAGLLHSCTCVLFPGAFSLTTPMVPPMVCAQTHAHITRVACGSCLSVCPLPFSSYHSLY